MNTNTSNKANQSIPYPFIRETLLPSEKLVYVTRPHWIIFGPCVATFIIALFIYYNGAAYLLFRFNLFGGYDLYQLLAGIIFLLGVYWLIQASIRFYTSEYGVTDKRVLMKTGWIRRSSVEIFLRKLESINVDQTVPGRILNYGTIVIIGTGGTEDYYLYVPDSFGFRKCVQQQADLLTDDEN